MEETFWKMMDQETHYKVSAEYTKCESASPEIALFLFILDKARTTNELRMSVPEINCILYEGKRSTEHKIRKAARKLIELEMIYLIVRDDLGYPRWFPSHLDTTAKWCGFALNPAWIFKGKKKDQEELIRKRDDDFEIMAKQMMKRQKK